VDAVDSVVDAVWEFAMSEEEEGGFIHHSSGTTHDSSPFKMSYILLSRYGRVESECTCQSLPSPSVQIRLVRRRESSGVRMVLGSMLVYGLVPVI
jgi:hypothetical protein